MNTNSGEKYSSNNDNEIDNEEVVKIVDESISIEIDKANKNKMWLHCDICEYKCTTEKNYHQAHEHKTQGLQIMLYLWHQFQLI